MGSRQQDGGGCCRGHNAQEVEETMGADSRLGYTASGLQKKGCRWQRGMEAAGRLRR